MIVCYSNDIKLIAIVRQYCEEQTSELTHDFLDYV